ncbi:MAG TPA: ankyrin repeat domain-containing protein [Candidatus Babeliales bacterium]|nr:ankyrin repeat domain-containing protein [Candidatus Babeliales bacterium]
MNSAKAIVTLLLLGNSISVFCMEPGAIVPGPILEKIAKAICSPQHIVRIVSEHAEHNKTPLITANITSLFKLEQKHIDKLFLQNVQDDTMRSLTLSMGADINARREDGSNCLWQVMNPVVLQELIEKGANVRVINNRTRTVLDVLGEEGVNWLGNNTIEEKITSVEMLSKAGAITTNDNALLVNILRDCKNDDMAVRVVTFFLPRMVDVNVPTPKYVKMYDSDGYTSDCTPLIVATAHNYIKTVELLLKGKVDPNISHDGMYPLHVAIGKPYSKEHFKPEIILLLLEHGADVNINHRTWLVSPLRAVRDLQDNAEKKDLAIFDKVIAALYKSGAKYPC